MGSATKRRSNLLREFVIRVLAQAFLSFFTAGATAVLTVVAVICLQLALDFLSEGRIFPPPTFLGVMLVLAIMAAKMTLPIWLVGNSMLVLSCAVPLFRSLIVWLIGSVVIAVSLSLAVTGGLPGNWKNIVMLFCYTGVASLAFRLLSLRLTIGLWSDWKTPGSERLQPSHDRRM